MIILEFLGLNMLDFTSYRGPYQLLNKHPLPLEKPSLEVPAVVVRLLVTKHFLLPPIVPPIGMVSFSILTSILLPESEFAFPSATQKVVITMATCIFPSVFLSYCFSIWLLAYQLLPPYSYSQSSLSL